MIKLKFSNLKVTTNGNITTGEVKVILKVFANNAWRVMYCKSFNTKVTLKPGDKFDLTKAYKYIQAKLEKEAYNWALKEVKRQIRLARRDLDIFADFEAKAKHIVDHDTEYLNKF